MKSSITIISTTILGLCMFVFYACKKKETESTNKLLPTYTDSSTTAMFQQTQGVTAALGGKSLALNDGRILWLFGASHLNDFTANQTIACSANAHNSAMIQTTSNTMQTLNAGNADFIPSNESNTWFTPLHAYQYEDTVFVFAKKESAVANYKTYIAKIHFPDMQFVRLDSMSLNTTIYGYNIIADTMQGFCFIYGLYQPLSASTSSLTLARFSLTSPHSTWLYYDNSKWYNPPSSASTIATIPAENVCIEKVKNKYILMTQDAGFTCNTGFTIYSKVASNPWGPFSNYVQQYQVADKLAGISPATKDVAIHRENINGNDEILMTYAINGYAPCMNTCNGGEDNPDYYRIKAVRIPLKNFDPGL